MPAYTVTAVDSNVRDWSSAKGGPMKSYRVNLKDTDGVELNGVEWARKATSPPPAVGQQLEGDVDLAAQYGPKFKQTPSASFGGGGRPRDPKDIRGMQRSHAQEMALRYVTAKGKQDFTWDALIKLVDAFDADVRKATEAA